MDANKKIGCKTMVEMYGPAMDITDQAQADQYFEMLVGLCMAARQEEGKQPDRHQCESVQRQNLGYFAGYYNNETRERVERLFKCEHPIFGAIAKNGPPSMDRAFSLGVIAGAKSRLKKEDN